MLLSLRKRLTIALYPDHVALLQTPRGWRPQSSRPILIECTPNTDGPVWQAPLTALRQALEQLKLESADVEVIVSDHFIRYALIPWSEAVQKSAELAILAQIHFEDLFGAAAQEWHIQTDCRTYDQTGMGCALDRTLFTSLQGLFAERKLHLMSLQPYFMCVMNRWRQRLGPNALVAIAESGQCIFVSLKDGAWHSARTLKVMDSITAALPVLVNREILLQGLDPKIPLYLHTLEPVDNAHLRQTLNMILLEMSPATAQQAPGLTMLASRVL
ncbi:MAG: hypothetical protein ACXWIN_00260 [Burkholderiaceae bacterium]